MHSKINFVMVENPDKTCWGKFYLPEGCLSPYGTHISEMKFGGLYVELKTPQQKDFSSKQEWRKALNAHLRYIEDHDEVVMTFGKMEIIWLKPMEE